MIAQAANAQAVLKGGFMFSGVFILLLLAMIVGLVAVVWARCRKRPKISEPSCGQCGYAVRGLPGFTCPECGSDLRDVGIVTPQARPRPSRVLPALGWTLLVLILFVVSTRLVVGSMRHTTIKSDTRTLKSPESQAYKNLILQADGPTRNGQFQVKELKMTLSPSTGNILPMDIDPDDLSYEYKDAKGSVVRQTTALDLEGMLVWMKEAGVDTASPGVRDEANEVVQYLQLVSDGLANNNYQFDHFRGQMRSHRSRGTASQDWVAQASIASWGVIWLLGIWRIARKRSSVTASNAALK